MKFLNLCIALAFGASPYVASASSILKPINPGEDTFVRLPKDQKKVAKVRLGVKIIPYNKVIVKDAQGLNKVRFAKGTPVKRNLRSRIDKKTNFYINDWHIELEPTSWDKNIMSLTYQVRLFKQYGKSKALEEKIGDLKVKGIIEGGRFVYEFSGKNSVKFTNKMGRPVAELHIQGPFAPTKKMNVARFKKKSNN